MIQQPDPELVTEVVAPNRATRDGLAIGYPVAMLNRKAYYMSPMLLGEPGKQLRKAWAKLEGLLLKQQTVELSTIGDEEDKLPKPPPEDTLELLDEAIKNVLRESLLINYTEKVIDQLLNGNAPFFPYSKLDTLRSLMVGEYLAENIEIEKKA